MPNLSTPVRESSSHGFCPKTYEFRLPTFLTGIASFQDRYLISEWFKGSHRIREANARSPQSLIYAGLPLGVPQGEIPG
jgi:hypothetical protein